MRKPTCKLVCEPEEPHEMDYLKKEFVYVFRTEDVFTPAGEVESMSVDYIDDDWYIEMTVTYKTNVFDEDQFNKAMREYEHNKKLWDAYQTRLDEYNKWLTTPNGKKHMIDKIKHQRDSLKRAKANLERKKSKATKQIDKEIEQIEKELEELSNG